MIMSTRLSRLACGLAAALLLSGTAALAAPQAPGDVPVIKYQVYALQNGLRVIIAEDHRLPLVAVNLWYHVGPANEEPGRTGFAHLFEHMMFQGSKHVPADAHFGMLEAAGASDINGTTDFDRTNYFETVPSNQLELALWLESDRMGYLPDRLTASNLANQQDVVRNERRQSVENEPYGIVEEGGFHVLFPKGHPYYAEVIGSHEDIQAAKLDDVRAFFRQYYAPNNASLAVVGDIDTAKAKALVEKYFGPLKRGPEVHKPNVTTPAITSERRAVITDTVELPKVYMSWITPSIFKPGDADATVAAIDSRRGQVEPSLQGARLRPADRAVRGCQADLVDPGIRSFRLKSSRGRARPPEQIEAGINAELEKFRAAGPDEKEVVRAQNGIETVIVNGLQRLGGFGGVADRLNMYEHYLGDPGYLSKDLARYRATTPQTVKAFATQYLQNANRVVVYGVPGEKKLPPEAPKPAAPTEAATTAEGVNVDEPWRAKPPAPGSMPTLALPTATEFKLPNGLTRALRATHGCARRGCAPGGAHRQRRQPGEHAGPRQLHRRDAGRGDGLAHRARDCRRRRAAWSDAHDRLDDGLVVADDAGPHQELPGRARPAGRRRLAPGVPGGGDRSSAGEPARVARAAA